MYQNKKDLSVFIGRFSPLHNGHCAVIDKAISTSKSVLILIGSSDKALTTKNPFSFKDRAFMIRSYLLAKYGDTMTNVIIKPLHDHMYNDQAWIRGVQDAVDEAKSELANIIGLNPTVYLTGANRDQSTWYLNAFGDTFTKDLVNADDHDFNLSATTVRELLFKSTDKKAQDATFDKLSKIVPGTTLQLLKNFVGSTTFDGLVKEFQYLENYKKKFAGLEYPVSIQTVDTCVIQSGHVLVAIRDNFPGRGLWCMPGGHLDVDKNERLVDAAIRELDEETNIGLSRAQLYGSIKFKECFDHPDRSLKARVITMCYLLKLDDTKPMPTIKPQRGEIKKLMWLPIAEALANRNRDKWFDDHREMLETMYNRIGSISN